MIPQKGSKASLDFYISTWKESTVKQLDSKISKEIILLAGGSDRLAEKVSLALNHNVIAINENDENDFYIKVQELIKSKLHVTEKTHITVMYRNQDVVNYSFVRGLLKTCELENPKLKGKVIGVDSLSIKELNTLIEILQSEHQDPIKEVRYVSGKREVQQLALTSLSDNQPVVTENGVYLIIGGTGGLGTLFAASLAKNKNVKLILTGRSKTSKLSTVALKEVNASYHCCDVTNKNAVDTLINEVLATYGKLNGIIHAAGVLKDSFLIHKTQEESMAVLSPKIDGAKYIDEATKDIDLDFMLYCSSISGVLGECRSG